MAASDAIYPLDQTVRTIESSGSSITDDSYVACSTALTEANIAGRPYGIVKFKGATGGFSAAPTVGNVLAVFERRTDGTDQEPVVDGNYEQHLLWTWTLDAADAQQTVYAIVPIWPMGATYYFYWKDGGTGTVSIDSGWTASIEPTTYGPSAS